MDELIHLFIIRIKKVKSTIYKWIFSFLALIYIIIRLYYCIIIEELSSIIGYF